MVKKATYRRFVYYSVIFLFSTTLIAQQKVFSQTNDFIFRSIKTVHLHLPNKYDTSFFSQQNNIVDLLKEGSSKFLSGNYQSFRNSYEPSKSYSVDGIIILNKTLYLLHVAMLMEVL